MKTWYEEEPRLFESKKGDLQDMTSVVVNINSIDKVKKFVNAITVYDNDFDLVCDRYVIDAKSIMGIFSLDLSQNLQLNIQKDVDLDAILADIDEFIVK